MDKDLEFTSAVDLYNRVKPALKTKLKELKRKELDYIRMEDIWNYLIKNKWMSANGLDLCDVVNDILNVDNNKIDEYVKAEHKRIEQEILEEDLDII